MQVGRHSDADNALQIKMRLSAKPDEKILAQFFYASLKKHPFSTLNEPTKPLIRIIYNLLDFNFSRKRILHYFSKIYLETWERLLFWIILAEEKPVGFIMVTWNEGKKRNNRAATIHDIYLLSEFCGKKIEEHAVTEILNFCDENNLRLGFPVNPEWKLFDNERKYI